MANTFSPFEEAHTDLKKTQCSDFNHTCGPSGILCLCLLTCVSPDVILSSAGHSDLCIGKGKII